MAFGASLRVLLAAVPLLLAASVAAQEYRSKASGNWNALSTWEQDNGSGWVDATVLPTNASGAITVRSPHTVTVTNTYSLDDVTIEAGATLTNTSGGLQWVLNNGTFGVKIFGTLNANSGTGSFGCCASVNIENGGVVNMNAGGAFFGPTTVQEGGTVNGNTSIDLAASTVVNNGMWTMNSSHALTLSAGGTFTNNGNLAWKAGTLSGTLTNNGTVTWAGGTVTSSPLGTINNGPSATFTMTGGTAQNGAINNQGTFTWAGGSMLSYTAIGTFLNATSAVFTLTGVSGYNTFYQAVTNNGTINFTGAGTLTPNPGTSITNTGAINVNAGQWDWNHNTTHTGSVLIASGATLHLFSGTATFNAGTTLMGTGTLRISGNATQNCPVTISNLTVLKLGGTWTNSTGNPTVFAEGIDLTWSGGTFAGTGGYTIDADVLITISGSGTLNSTLTNNGTINWSGGQLVGTGNIQNASGGAWNITFSGISNPLAVTVVNSGAINYNHSGTFNTFFPFTNNGVLNINSGQWHFNNSAVTNTGELHMEPNTVIQVNVATTLSSTSSITGAGTIRIANTLTQNFPWIVSNQAVELIGGTWNGSGAISFAPPGVFNWTAGTLASTGGYTLQNGEDISLYTANGKTLNSTLTNNGTINWSGGTISGSGNIQNTSGAVFNINYNTDSQLQVPFTNQAGGTMNQNGTGLFNSWYYLNYGAITNAGTINLVNGNWRTDNTFTNSGTINIPAGRTFTFNGPTTNLNAGTTFTGAGNIVQQNGAVNQNFPWTNTTHQFTLSGGTWTNSTGNPTTFGVGSTFNWTGGTLAGAGNYTVQPAFTVAISTNEHALNSVLTNNGTINWSGGGINGGGSIQNTSGAVFNIGFIVDSQLQVPFTNQVGATVNQNGTGTFNTFYFSTYGVFTNAGTINLVNGNWRFDNTNTHSATSALNIATSRTLTFNTAPGSFAGTVSNSGTVAGTINGFTGPTFSNNGSVTLANLPFTGSAAQTLDGTGTIAQLTLNNANGLVLGGTQTVSNTLALTNGKITLSDNDLILTHATPGNLSGANASRYIVTNGTGSLRRQVTGANVPFPIGTATGYLPATISLTNGPAEAFGARVQEGVYSDYGTPGTPTGNLVQNHQVERIWVLSEQTEGDNQATVLLQWNTADEGADFDRTNSGLYSYNGTDWVALDLAAAAGSNPYTRSAANVALFREFTVADGESTLAVACEGGLVPGTACDDGDDCTTNDVINAECECVGILQDADNDGTCDAEDECPNDPLKTTAGACGCGMPDVPATYYVDADGDGYGTGAPVPGFTCDVPAGHVMNNSDCDDGDPNIHPGASEVCNGIDDNCDGEVDNTSLGTGLVAYWSFNGDVQDHSTQTNHGSTPAGTAWTTGVNGTANGAFQFGGNRYVLVPDNDVLDFGTDAFTYSVWLKWSGGGLQNIFDKGNSCCSPYTGLQAFVDYSTAGTFTGRTDFNKTVTSSGGLGNNAWHHVVYTRDGNTMRVYVDGVLNNTASHAVDNLTNTIALYIGRNSASASQFYTGAMDNLRLYNRALTASEIAELHAWEQVAEVGTGTGTIWYADADGDGFGDPAVSQVSCTPIPGYVTNNSDLCDNDPDKQEPGGCGCGVVDVPATYYADTDGDGFGDPDSPLAGYTCEVPDGYVTDNTDLCPGDAAKQAPGACGCGVTDEVATWYADTDGDGFGDPDSPLEGLVCDMPPTHVPNNTDGCPTDANKQAPGACGCGTVDTDSDGDGTADCIDGCPNDPLKTNAGACGCGNPDIAQDYYADTDGDGLGAGPAIPGFTCDPPANTVTNNSDGCPSDPLKTAPGACGCGNADTDSDSDGAADCIDGCPNDPLKTSAGACDCGNPDTDSDGDNAADCVDGCPNDPLKTTPGSCGCGNLDTDSDGDLTADCIDGCPNDPLKTNAGACGCGNADTDSDGDGVPDCIDPCPAMTGVPGDACNDGNPTTTNDQVQADCTCAGEPVDCAGVPNGLHQVDNCGQCLLPTDPNFVSATFGLAFSGNPGFTNALVSPVSGAPDDVFTAEAVYTHSGNEPLPAGWPRLLLDFEGNGTFAGANDRTILMTAVDPADATTSDGKLYRATFSSLPSGTNWQARIVAENGPCTAQIGPFGQPDVMIAPDLEIFASDISFSTANPAVSSALTVYATLRNNSDLAAQNFTVHLVNQFNPGTAYTDILVGYLAPHGSTTVSWNITTPGVPAWCPMQVFVDHGNAIPETNEMNNTAIRPFTNGNYNVPGAIDANASANPADAYQGTTTAVHIQGQALYSGTAVPLADPSVAGAQVTVTATGVGTFYGLTDASGHYDVPVPANGPLGQTNVTVTVTDFTLTSNTATTQYTQHPPLNCLPDLTVLVGVAPGAVVQGGTVTATVTVTNNGCANAPASTTTLASNAGLAVAQLSVPALATGASYTTSVTTDPLGTPGAYVICATADGLFQLEESSEQNEQCAAFSVLANAPDLVPGAPLVQGSLDCAAAAPQFSVTNAGAAPAAAFNVAVRIRRNGTVVFTDDHAVAGLASLQHESWTLPFSYSGPGLYQFEVDVDTPLPNGSVAESQEGNNTFVLVKNVEACIADLAIAGCTGLSTSPAEPAFPGTVTYQATVVNNGSATANGPINVAFHVSGQGTLTASYPGNLAPGASAMVQVSTASVAPGTATLTATVDPDDLLEEDAEVNNSASMAICSDLRPQPICGPWGVNFWENSYVINSTLLPRIGLLSEGLYGIAQAKVRFEVAGPGIAGTVNLGDATLNNVGRTCGCPLVAALPNTFLFTQAGTYTFTITVDPDDVNVECSEANNVMVRHITVTNLPDLRTLSQHIAPSLLNPDVNEPITFDVTYENIGNGNPGDILGMTVEVDGLPFATVSGLPGLLSGGSHSVAIPGNFASNVVGVHTVRAVIDDGNDVAEGDELNNEATRTFVVGPAANLFFDSFASSVAAPSIGQSIQVLATVANGGSAPINAAVLFCYVNAANDTVPFGLQSIELAELGSTALTQPWTVTQLPVTVVGRIVNATGLEFNYEDNSASFELGTFNVTLTATAACMAIPGTLQATVSGGTAPYTFNWSNGAQGDLLTAVAGNYIVGVTDANGVFASASGTIDNGPDSDNDGTPDCIDLCPNDPNKTDPGTCGCGTADTDSDGDGLADCMDNCPATPGVQGDTCDDLDTNTSSDVIDANCECHGTPVNPCTESLSLDITLDNFGSQTTWEVREQTGNTVVAAGGPYQNGIGGSTFTETICLDQLCYRLVVSDAAGDGITSGGYRLRDAAGNRIIDNTGNFNIGNTSAIGAGYGNGAFCLPLGSDKLIHSSCDKLDWMANQFVVAVANPAVAAQYGVSNTTSGYEFWFFDPNGSYSFRRFRSHATSDGTGTGANRACHFKVNGWMNSGSTPHLPDGVLLNVRVRGRVAGINLSFGPACTFKLDAALAACPRVKLQDDPTNTSDFSCGVTRRFGGASNASNRIYAKPPQPVPAVPSSMVRYQFRFRIAGEGVCIVRPPQTSARMVLNWTNGPALQCTKTYEVDVRVSINGGATWCFGPAGTSQASACADTEDWGTVCSLTIACNEAQHGATTMALAIQEEITLYPNPNQGDQLFVNITGVKQAGTANLCIYDLAGKRVVERTLTVQEGIVNTHLDLHGLLPSGVYVVHITSGLQIHSERLVIQK